MLAADDGVVEGSTYYIIAVDYANAIQMTLIFHKLSLI